MEVDVSDVSEDSLQELLLIMPDVVPFQSESELEDASTRCDTTSLLSVSSDDWSESEPFLDHSCVEQALHFAE